MSWCLCLLVGGALLAFGFAINYVRLVEGKFLILKDFHGQHCNLPPAAARGPTVSVRLTNS